MKTFNTNEKETLLKTFNINTLLLNNMKDKTYVPQMISNNNSLINKVNNNETFTNENINDIFNILKDVKDYLSSKQCNIKFEIKLFINICNLIKTENKYL